MMEGGENGSFCWNLSTLESELPQKNKKDDGLWQLGNLLGFPNIVNWSLDHGESVGPLKSNIDLLNKLAYLIWKLPQTRHGLG